MPLAAPATVWEYEILKATELFWEGRRVGRSPSQETCLVLSVMSASVGSEPVQIFSKIIDKGLTHTG